MPFSERELSKGKGGGWEYHHNLFPARARAELLKRETAQVDGGKPASQDRNEAWATFDMLPEKTKVLTNMEALIHQFMVGTETSSAPAAGEVYFGCENPKGELGFYLRSDGAHEAARLRIRGPSFANLQILEETLLDS